jgi:tetratricopeptide (TPR) repeat protein
MGKRLAVCLAVSLAACDRPPAGGPAPGAPPVSSPVAEGRQLLESGQLDAALSKLQEAPNDPDSLYLQGVVWVKKAETAPLPTPPPASGARGAHPRAPEFKSEELQALDRFEKAVAIQPAHARAQMAIGDLLAPHAIRRQALDSSGGARGGKRARAADLPDAGLPAADYGPDRVIEAYRRALQADATATEPVEKLIQFATQVGRVDDVEQALQELLKRDRERPEPLIRYGDFLTQQRNEPERAIEQYRQALIWRPDDQATKSKIAEVYIAQGIGFYAKSQYAVAQARFEEARKYAGDPRSPEALKIQDYMRKLNAIRNQPAAR